MIGPTRPAGLVLLASLLLFGCGVLAQLAWAHGLYANAVVSVLLGLWLASALLWRMSRPVAPAPADPVPAARLEALEIERRRLQAMLDQAPAPLMTADIDGVLRAANRAARRLFATDDRIVGELPALRDAIERIRPGERMVLRLLSDRADADDRSYALSVAERIGLGGDSVRLAMLVDIQTELQAAEAAALRDLLQVLSHEIMNSLTPVTSLAESAHALLATEEVGPEALAQAAGALETILRRARGLDRFVRGYRMMARLPDPVPRPVGLARLLDEAARLFRTRWGEAVTLRLRAPDPDVIVRLDPDLLVQALLALLGNAAEAALAGGAPATVTLSGAGIGVGAAIRVADSGAGIPPGQEEAIFRYFFTTKPDGTGVGLALARQIVHSLGGTIRLEPPEGDIPDATVRGAAFLLTLRDGDVAAGREPHR